MNLGIGASGTQHELLYELVEELLQVLGRHAAVENGALLALDLLELCLCPQFCAEELERVLNRDF